MITALFIHKDGTVTAPLNEDGNVIVAPNDNISMKLFISIGERKGAKTKLINIHPDDL
jgi:hypothetical protein